MFVTGVGNPELQQALDDVAAAGVTVVVAAGNDPASEFTEHVPAAYGNVIPVASVAANDGQIPSEGPCANEGLKILEQAASYFSTDGVGVVSAPGEHSENVSKGCSISSVGILSDAMGGGTSRKSGTSMA